MSESPDPRLPDAIHTQGKFELTADLITQLLRQVEGNTGIQMQLAAHVENQSDRLDEVVERLRTLEVASHTYEIRLHDVVSLQGRQQEEQARQALVQAQARNWWWDLLRTLLAAALGGAAAELWRWWHGVPPKGP